MHRGTTPAGRQVEVFTPSLPGALQLTQLLTPLRAVACCAVREPSTDGFPATGRRRLRRPTSRGDDPRAVQSVGIHLMTLCMFIEQGTDPALGTRLHRLAATGVPSPAPSGITRRADSPRCSARRPSRPGPRPRVCLGSGGQARVGNPPRHGPRMACKVRPRRVTRSGINAVCSRANAP